MITYHFSSGGRSLSKYKIIHIHWHDNHGNKDEHLPIGADLIDHQRAI